MEEPGGIDRAAQQGTEAFEVQQFPSPMPPPPPMPIEPPAQPEIPGLSPNSLFTRPHFMEGGFYVAADRMSWWNGVMWIPGRPPGSSNAGQTGAPVFPSPAAPLALFLVALAIMAVIGFIAWSAFQSMHTLGPGPPLP